MNNTRFSQARLLGKKERSKVRILSSPLGWTSRRMGSLDQDARKISDLELGSNLGRGGVFLLGYFGSEGGKAKFGSLPRERSWTSFKSSVTFPPPLHQATDEPRQERYQTILARRMDPSLLRLRAPFHPFPSPIDQARGSTLHGITLMLHWNFCTLRVQEIKDIPWRQNGRDPGEGGTGH